MKTILRRPEGRAPYDAPKSELIEFKTNCRILQGSLEDIEIGGDDIDW